MSKEGPETVIGGQRGEPLRASEETGAAVAEPTARPARNRGSRADRPEDQPAPEASPPIDLKSHELYLNRELTWLNFNRRVLHEAQDDRNPLLERLKFLAIVSGNLDEFFMKRIGGLKQQVGAGVHDLTVDGRTPEQQIGACLAFTEHLTRDLRSTYLDLLGALAPHDIAILTWDKLSAKERLALREHYLANIFPLVTPNFSA